VSIVRIAMSSLLLTLMAFASGCVVEHDRGYHEGYREGYYDREHHRWWHEQAWRDCVEHDEHCRD
jgi:hypothetical protein